MSRRLFELTEDTNPDDSNRIAFGRATFNSLNMTFTNFYAFLRSKLIPSETVAGLMEIATDAEVTTGTDDVRAITPLKLKNALGLRQVLVDIGVWNMDTTASLVVNMPAEVPAGGIKFVDAWIVSDELIVPDSKLDQQLDPLTELAGLGGWIEIPKILPTSVTLHRVTGGRYDSAAYDSTGSSRGRLIVTYQP